MKTCLILLSVMLMSCAVKKTRSNVPSEITANSKKLVVVNTDNKFAAYQDSIRTVLLASKTNSELKTNNILQELYIRGLVNEVNAKIRFQLPFNLHSFDCGAPDCYTTDVLFNIKATVPIRFPKVIKVQILEHGCGIPTAMRTNATFKLVEQTTDYINYYSKEARSNLIIIGSTKELYYFDDVAAETIKVGLIAALFDKDTDDPDAILPYRSAQMVTNEYQLFLKN